MFSLRSCVKNSPAFFSCFWILSKVYSDLRGEQGLWFLSVKNRTNIFLVYYDFLHHLCFNPFSDLPPCPPWRGDFGFTLRPHPYALDPSCKISFPFCAARLTFLVSQCFVFLIVSMFLCVLCVDSKSPCG